MHSEKNSFTFSKQRTGNGTYCNCRKENKGCHIKNSCHEKASYCCCVPKQKKKHFLLNQVSGQEHVINFQWLVDSLKVNKNQTERVIIYCQKIKQCHKIYSILIDDLGDFNQANPLNRKQKLIEILHSNTLGWVKDEIIESMSNANGHLRALVCTIAFGMDIDCEDVKTVIHLGPSRNVESSVQESGRCGRQGCQSNAIIYYVGRMLTHADKHMKRYVNLHADYKTCRREYVLNHFSISKDEMNLALSYELKHNCCDLCAKTCSYSFECCKPPVQSR